MSETQTITPLGGTLLHGAGARAARARNMRDAVAHIWSWGATDAHAIGQALGLGRAAAYRLIQTGIADGFFKAVKETGMPGSVIILTHKAATEFRNKIRSYDIADLPIKTRPSSIFARKLPHDLIAQHAAVGITMSGCDDFYSGEDSVNALIAATDEWLFTDFNVGRYWPRPAFQHSSDVPVILPERVVKHLEILIGAGLENTKPAVPDALIFSPFRPGEKPETWAVEVQESNQGLTRDRRRMATYGKALAAGQIDRLMVVSSSEAIANQHRKIVDTIAAGRFFAPVFDALSGEWHRNETAMNPAIAGKITVGALPWLRPHYYLGGAR